ncbi:DUF1365 domain-containing protein [Marinobacter sp. JSM 1782161]|uniref:DUF1365 domain-containing protein n=1 Tax=Marinobacter sp. JSM 1782161 TaxID=2685906 RepID=UPI001D19142E|nr:DUF1365 domain-containing protein [Marinobacter sp. JSM 1782161]
MTDRALRSHWLEGSIRHRRMTPVRHAFRYDTGMLALDLDDWPRIDDCSRLLSRERFNWLSLKRSDYFAPERGDLKQAIADQVEQATGWRPTGRIELITHPRYLGYVFNPVSFYCCYDDTDDPTAGALPRVVAAQITNTPWHERHLYCLTGAPVTTTDAGWRSQRYIFSKRFHVSPFNPMDQEYRWLFSACDDQLRIHMNVLREGQKVFDATLAVQRTPLTRISIRRHVRRFPLESIKVASGIYWHALKLKIKGAVFHTHPDKLAPNDPAHRLGHDDQGERVDPAVPGTGKVSSWRT